ncbi:MAG: hypothetical protein HUJ29_04840, partial [Gammaproteobacteria bacterium]|nr:hypothetical protein [Gammaproteobacteria bacterium]
MSEVINESFTEEPALGSRKAAVSDEALLRERYNLFYSQASIGLVPVILALLVATYLVYERVNLGWISAWVAIISISYAWRFKIRHDYRVANWQDKTSKRWLYLNIVSVALTGLSWSIGSVLFFPVNALDQLWLILILGFLAAGNSLTHAALPWVSQVFIVTILVPMLVYLINLGTERYLIAAGILFLFVSSLIAIGFRTQKFIVNSILERFSAEVLVRHFQEANVTANELNIALAQEIADKKRVEKELSYS